MSLYLIKSKYKKSLYHSNGLVFPEEILSEIWLMVGLESLESLHRCRQVCQTWNELIMKNIWENTRNKNMIVTRIERNWAPGKGLKMKEISHAWWLCKQKILCNLFLKLYSFFLQILEESSQLLSETILRIWNSSIRQIINNEQFAFLNVNIYIH